MMSKEYYYLKYLNDNCQSDEQWYYKNKVYCIKVYKNEIDTIEKFVNGIVGCSFFYDLEDNSLNLKITESTLEYYMKDTIII